MFKALVDAGNIFSTIAISAFGLSVAEIRAFLRQYLAAREIWCRYEADFEKMHCGDLSNMDPKRRLQLQLLFHSRRPLISVDLVQSAVMSKGVEFLQARGLARYEKELMSKINARVRKFVFLGVDEPLVRDALDCTTIDRAFQSGWLLGDKTLLLKQGMDEGLIAIDAQDEDFSINDMFVQFTWSDIRSHPFSDERLPPKIGIPHFGAVTPSGGPARPATLDQIKEVCHAVRRMMPGALPEVVGTDVVRTFYEEGRAAKEPPTMSRAGTWATEVESNMTPTSTKAHKSSGVSSNQPGENDEGLRDGKGLQSKLCAPTSSCDAEPTIDAPTPRSDEQVEASRATAPSQRAKTQIATSAATVEKPRREPEVKWTGRPSILEMEDTDDESCITAEPIKATTTTAANDAEISASANRSDAANEVSATSQSNTKPLPSAMLRKLLMKKRFAKYLKDDELDAQPLEPQASTDEYEDIFTDDLCPTVEAPEDEQDEDYNPDEDVIRKKSISRLRTRGHPVEHDRKRDNAKHGWTRRINVLVKRHNTDLVEKKASGAKRAGLLVAKRRILPCALQARQAFNPKTHAPVQRPA